MYLSTKFQSSRMIPTFLDMEVRQFYSPVTRIPKKPTQIKLKKFSCNKNLRKGLGLQWLMFNKILTAILIAEFILMMVIMMKRMIKNYFRASFIKQFPTQ